MRFSVTALFLAGAACVTAQITDDFLGCAAAALDSIDVSKLADCTDLTSTECLCANKDAITELSDDAKDACDAAGIDLSKLNTTLCADTSNTAAPARHASNPMEPATGRGTTENSKRAFRFSGDEAATPHVIYVTETLTECSCKSTSAPASRMHISQIPVSVPVSSSMAAKVAASTPASTHSAMMAASSSVIFGSQMSAATPGPSGASANRFKTFQGAAPKANAVRSGVAALGIAAVMGLVMVL
ncbi:uncharacterized protein N7482_000500 [Penicillium canariense]|uniref:Extracellular membrane protein CFEM domain-containing protein n=1 Tax=Penicillium canariense TaxID=189055 RepID=A0A9W9IBI6_9EURO|nr:uncharacterized protein N7482_000500 [Penicillium canariense]KAJ5174623.1 hypothetical protein N7482_000500 [Penicillium canariense]